MSDPQLPILRNLSPKPYKPYTPNTPPQKNPLDPKPWTLNPLVLRLGFRFWGPSGFGLGVWRLGFGVAHLDYKRGVLGLRVQDSWGFDFAESPRSLASLRS